MKAFIAILFIAAHISGCADHQPMRAEQRAKSSYRRILTPNNLIEVVKLDRRSLGYKPEKYCMRNDKYWVLFVDYKSRHDGDTGCLFIIDNKDRIVHVESSRPWFKANNENGIDIKHEVPPWMP